MAANRNGRGRQSIQSVLNGTADYEREEKLNQQRDYAAQLQEQIRQRNAHRERERTRKVYDPNDQEAPLQPHENAPNNQNMPAASSPVRSPVKIAQAPAAPSSSTWHPLTPPTEYQAQPSPMKPPSFAASNHYPYQNMSVSAPMVVIPPPSFVAGPSLFEPLIDQTLHLQHHNSFYQELERLQRTRTEIETAWKQRQSSRDTVKPSFLPIATTTSPSKRKQPIAIAESEPPEDPDEDSQHVEEEEQELGAQYGGLSGESVLVPLPSGMMTSPTRRHRSVTQLQLRHESELLRFSMPEQPPQDTDELKQADA